MKKIQTNMMIGDTPAAWLEIPGAQTQLCFLLECRVPGGKNLGINVFTLVQKGSDIEESDPVLLALAEILKNKALLDAKRRGWFPINFIPPPNLIIARRPERPKSLGTGKLPTTA